MTRIDDITRLAAIVLAAIFAIAPADAAQWDHVHLTVPDTQAAVEWYTKYFGGEATKSGPFDAIWFGPDLLKFRGGGPEIKPSAGSPVNHIGFAVDSVQSMLDRMRADGVKVVVDLRRLADTDIVLAHIEDPWGTRIELIEDDDTKGFHHIHLLADDPEKTLQWYVDIYGGTITSYKGVDRIRGIKYGDMWLIATTPRGELSEFKGRAIDHIGWNMKDWDETIQKLKDRETVFQLEPRQSGDHKMAFIEGPHAVKIELVEDIH